MNKPLSWLIALGLLLYAALTVGAESGRETQTTARERPALRVVLNSQQPPFVTTDETGTLGSGMLVDLWRHFARQQNIGLELLFLPHQQALAAVAEGRADVYGGVESHHVGALLAGPQVTQHAVYLWQHQNTPLLPALESAQAWVVGVLEGSPYHIWVEHSYPQIKIRTYATTDALFEAARSGEVRAFLFNEYLDPVYDDITALVRQYPIFRRIRAGDIELTAALRPGQEQLLELLTEGLQAIGDEERQQFRFSPRLADESVLRVSAPVAAWPLAATNEQGDLVGLLIDLWRQWSSVTGVPVEFIPAEDVQGYVAVVDEDVDVLLAATDESIDRYDLIAVQQYYQTPLQVHVHTAQTEARRFTELPSGAVIGALLSHSRQAERLRTFSPRVEVRLFERMDRLERAMERQEIQGYLAPTLLIDNYRQRGSVTEEVRVLPAPQIALPVHIAVANDSGLIERIRDGFAMIPWQERVRLEERWVRQLQLQHYRQLPQRIVLESGERQWLENLGTVRVGLPAESGPIIMRNSQGDPVGLDADFIQLIEERTPLLVDWVSCGDWQQCLDALRYRHIDALTFVSDTPARREFANFTDVYWETPWAVASREQDPIIANTLEELSGYRIAMVASYSVVDDLERIEGVSIVSVMSPEEGLTAVLEGAADGYVDSLPLLIERIREQHTGNLRLSLLREAEGDAVTVGVRNDWPELIPVLNRAIASISEEERAKISERWFNFQFEEGVSAELVRRWALRAALIFLVTLTVFWAWNSRLRQEIKRRKEVEGKIQHLAKHDDLTQLPNRSLLMDRLQQAVHLHTRHGNKFAVMFLDLDGFKEVNDNQGHEAGDRLLVEVAQRLSAALRKNDTVSRFGGDEFVVMLTELGDAEQAVAVARKLIADVTQPYQLEGVSADVTVSIGVAMFPDHAERVDVLLRLADIAMYRVKRRGKNDVLLARPDDLQR